MGWDGRIGMGAGIMWVAWMEQLIEQWSRRDELTSIYILYRGTDGSRGDPR